MTAPVAIAIVGYRNAGDVRCCLAALAASTEKNFTVSICENGGPAAYKDLIAGLKGLVDFEGALAADQNVCEARAGKLRPGGEPVRVFCATGNLGYAGGVNVVLRVLANGAWSALWILNPDTEPEPGALKALVARAREGYGVVGSRLVYKATHQVQAYGGRWRPNFARAQNIGMFQPEDAAVDSADIERAMNYVLGTALFATKAFVDAVGPMDERYFLYCEEVDWCLRRGARRLGYAHDSLIYHQGSSTIGANAPVKERSGLSVYLAERNRLLLTRQFYPWRFPLVTLVALALTGKYILAGAFKNFFVALSGWWAGIRGETGRPARWAGS
jgi:N-acetylglucosaminyl-diphospho-decaprenol L-rhamnosyltransferase